jgi:glucosamine-6-phosphate deaminase
MSEVQLHVHRSAEQAVRELADEIEALIHDNRESGRSTVLGLATGRTPVLLYRELVRRHRGQGLSMRDVTTFNLDEYLGLPADHEQSYRRFMRENLFEHVDMAPDRTHIPDGMVDEARIAGHCAAYEAAIADAGGIDLQILGIGRTGHIGFNEPGSPVDSRTRVVTLDELTRRDAAPAFGGLDQVPTRAITMGCGTILEARRVRLMAWGESKAMILEQAFRGPVTERVPASFLQRHAEVRLLLDEAAAAGLG